MKLQDLSLEQLKEIEDGAPDGAEHCFFDSWADDEKGIWYYKDNGNQSFDSGRWSFAYDPQFPRKLDDRLVSLNDIRNRITELEPADKVTRHLLENPAAFLAALKKQSLQPDTITTQLDSNKCSKVDPALAYDSPGDCPKDDFDAMSEKHRSPSCKCQEFPIDAELKPDPFQQAKNKQHKEISQGKCGEFMAGYDRGFLTAWNEREDQVQFEMQNNRQLQERINELERRNRAFLEKNVDLERSCKMQHAEWSHMKQLLDKARKGDQAK